MQHPFAPSASSEEITTSWKHLMKILLQERDLHALNETRNLIHRDGIDNLMDTTWNGIDTCEALHRRNKLNLDFPKDMESAIQSALEVYNAAVARTMFRMLSQVLPRELRDMVYTHLFSDDVHICIDQIHRGGVIVHEAQSQQTKPRRVRVSQSYIMNLLLQPDFPGSFPGSHYIESKPRLYLPKLPRSQSDALCSADFWSETVTGLDVGKELAESWYRISEFHVTTHTPSLGLLTNALLGTYLLNTDRFKLGLKPQELISHITRDLHLTHSNWNRDKWVTAVEAVLLQLTQFKSGTHIHLQLFFDSFHSSEQANDELLTFMSQFRTTLVALRKSNYHLTIMMPQQRSVTEMVRAVMNEQLQSWVEKFDGE